MKLTKSKLKRIIQEELKEGWNPFSSDKDDPIGNLKSMLKDSKKLLNDLESDKLTVGMAAMTADNQRDKTSKLQQKVLEKGDSRQIEKMKKIVDMIMKLHRVVFDRDEAEQRSSEDRRQPAYGIEPTWGGGLTQAGPIRESNMKLTKSKLKQLIKEELGTELGGTFPGISEEESLHGFWMDELLPLVERYLRARGEEVRASGGASADQDRRVRREMPTQFLERMIQFVRDQGY